MSLFDKEQLNVDGIFNKFYEVPSYQREYVWKRANVLALLNDIKDSFDSDSENDYFIGTTVVAPNLSTSYLEVIDGQQRLTTLFILMISFANKIDKQALAQYIKKYKTDSLGNAQEEFHLNLNYGNAQQFLELISGDKPDSSELSNSKDKESNNLAEQLHNKYGKKFPETIKNLYNAYQAIDAFLAEHFITEEKLRAFKGYILNHVIVLQISTDISKALQIFETINERGIGLNPLDLIKNRLFSNIEKKEFETLKGNWHDVFKPFKRNETHKLRFFRYFLMASFPDKISSKEYKDGIIRTNDIFNFVSKLSEIKDPFNFLTNLEQAAKDYNGFLEGKLDNENNVNLQNINTLNGGLSTYIIALLAAKKLPSELLKHFITQLESYMFFYIIPGNNTNKLEKECSTWAKELYRICQITDKAQQLTEYNSFIQKFLISPTQDRGGNFEDYFLRLEMDKNITKNKVRYILNKISSYVHEKWNGCSEGKNLFGAYHIEHILPNKPKDELRNAFGADIYEEYKNRLGNLTLLEQSLNKSLGNDFFEKKKPVYAQSTCILTKSIVGLTITTDIKSQHGQFFSTFRHWEKWDKNSIEDRQQFLLDLTKEIWEIKIFTTKDN